MRIGDRFWLAIGSGEALNESITGDAWPPKPIRNARLEEAARTMRALWAGETVSHEGYSRVKEAHVYSSPGKLLNSLIVYPMSSRACCRFP
jgi:coenzyme F420-dependent glucose-6-phosphate dehydrogenase